MKPLAVFPSGPYINVMHELSIAQDILDIIRQNLPGDAPRRVRTVRVRIGDMAGIVPDSLEFCFQAITPGTVCEGATLAIERVPVVLRCNDCGRESALEHLLFACPSCGSTAVAMISGNELHVVEFEIDDPQTEAA